MATTATATGITVTVKKARAKR
ncbi:uncharacterized protein G2W53_029783 [Senna tora]|uniref:Uncharacterized protein n=1 Tax=Senna tora TaxID=362788 RepID=A0A834T515_9FABA|nr:uncharacterized protein G2W53_029783 [Senna tora]